MAYYRNNAQFPNTSAPFVPLGPYDSQFTLSSSVPVYEQDRPKVSRTTPSPPSSPPSFPPHLTPPRTYKDWQAKAKVDTAEYKTLGYSSPVAWVYVEGHEIPLNAVVGGVDRKTGIPWYVARAFYEGNIELGKAGKQFERGAAVVYNDRQRPVDAYEVLVEARTPTRWIYQEAMVPVVSLPKIEATISTAPARLADKEAAALRRFKTVVLVDDSVSMEGQPWADACEALAGIAELSTVYDADGPDVYFLNDTRFQLDLRDRASVRNIFNSVQLRGQTPTGARLNEVLDKYIQRLEDSSRHQKPISIIVITDGVPTDDPKSVIIEAARRLDRSRIRERQLGIQFVQIGNDSEASYALKELDDDLSAQHGVRDMVDTTLFDPREPRLRTESLLKILTGALDSDLDNGGISPSFPSTRYR